MNQADRSWEDIIASMDSAIGGSSDFDWEAVEAIEAVEAMVQRYGALGMNEQLAAELVPLLGAGKGEDEARFGVVLREVLALVIYAEVPRLVAEQLRLAFGFRESNHESVRNISRRYGVTPQAISKAVLEYQERLSLPKNTFNKTAAACAVYAQTNKAKLSHEI